MSTHETLNVDQEDKVRRTLLSKVLSLRRSSAKTTLLVLIRSNAVVDFLPGLVLPLVGLEPFPSFDLASVSAIAVGTEPSLVFRFFVTFESAGSSL